MVQVLSEMPVRNPVNGTFELTLRCNLHCKMCMLRHDDQENPDLIKHELTAAEWIDMAKQVAQAGTLHLLITGGEPFLRPDFCEIWEGIYKQGFIMTLYTNAVLVNDTIMKTLRKYPPHTIGVTIYGASPETYEKVCGNADAFQKMIDGVHQLQTLPSNMEFRTTIIKENFADAKAIDELAFQQFGLKYGVKQAAPVNKAVRGACANVEACRVDPEQDMQMKVQRIVDAFHEIVGDRFNPNHLTIERKEEVETATKKTLTFFGCQAGISQYTITYSGKLLACQMIEPFFTDAKQQSFQEAWKQFPAQVHFDHSHHTCQACEYADYCLSCFASRYAETGHFDGCSPYIYETAKARKKYETLSGGKNDERCQL